MTETTSGPARGGSRAKGGKGTGGKAGKGLRVERVHTTPACTPTTRWSGNAVTSS